MKENTRKFAHETRLKLTKTLDGRFTQDYICKLFCNFPKTTLKTLEFLSLPMLRARNDFGTSGKGMSEGRGMGRADVKRKGERVKG